jgi:hypothetical protein
MRLSYLLRSEFHIFVDYTAKFPIKVTRITESRQTKYRKIVDTSNVWGDIFTYYF